MTILTLPRLGETMEEARVTAWLVAPGATFRRGDVLLEVETDKTVVEVPALQEGVLRAQLVVAGQRVALGAPIAEIEGEAASAAGAPEGVRVAEPGSLAPPVPDLRVPDLPARPAASPRARAMARAAGVDLAALRGSGRRGRIMGADVPQGTQSATVVLLHGLYDTQQAWRDLARRLARAGLAVAMPDLPGHGDAAPPAGDLEDAAQAMLAGLPPGRLLLVGHSLGAVFATRLALRLGARVEALVLLAPAGLGARINAEFLDGMAQAQTPAALARALALLGGDPLSPAALQAELARLAPLRPGIAALAQAVAVQGMQQIDIAADLAGLACPVTALFGLCDRIIDWRDCANLPARAAIHLLPGCGHLPHACDPDLVLDLIRATARAP